MKLSNLYEIQKSTTTSREFFIDDNGIKCVHYGDIYKNYSFRFIKSSNIINSFSKDVKNEIILREDAIIIPDVTETVSDYGHPTYIEYDGTSYINGTHTLAIKSKGGNLKYLFYYLQNSCNIKRLQSLLLGSTVFGISKKDFENFELINYSEDKAAQQHIVDIIGSIDDKIEYNNKIINKFLNYKHLDFKKIYANINKDETKILDIVKFLGGSQPPKSEHIYENKSGYVRFIQNRDYNSEGHLTYIKESKKNKLCSRYDIMMDKYGEAGKVRFGIDGAYNVALAKIQPVDENLQEDIREFFSQEDVEKYLSNSSIASTRASVSEENLNNMYIKIPDSIVLANFQNRHHKMIEYILNIKEENKKLRDLKDLYLKKFFS